jgi:hypothetical protein
MPAILVIQELKFEDPIKKKKKNPSPKKGWGGSRCSPEFKPQYCKTKQNQKKKERKKKKDSLSVSHVVSMCPAYQAFL